MSKGALAIMTRNLAYGLMRHHIRVNQVNPGWMDTESEHRTQITYDGAPDNWLEIAEAGRPFGRLVKPWEVANLIAFCLSDESGVMTGNLIDVDQNIFSEDHHVTQRILDATESGDAAVNDCAIQPLMPELPFGGVGNSGMGKYHGLFGFEAFTNARGVLYHGALLDPGVKYPPYGEHKGIHDAIMHLMP